MSGTLSVRPTRKPEWVGITVDLWDHIPEVFNLNLGWDTSYPDWGLFMVFISSSRYFLPDPF
jgi:hypothetical protein